MAMGTRKQREKQEDIWIAHTELPSAPGHPFYQRLNELLEAEKFDEFVEGRCAKFYAAKYGRPSLTPGIYFRSLLLGYFEGIDSERGIAWQLARMSHRGDRNPPGEATGDKQGAPQSLPAVSRGCSTARESTEGGCTGVFAYGKA